MTKMLFSAVVGSEAFGLARLESDIDIRGVYGATLAETLDPFTTVSAPTHEFKEGYDVYFHELSHFINLLGKQDINAWQALCSRKNVCGVMAQGALRNIAMRYFIQPLVMVEKARAAAHQLMVEAEKKESGKLMAIGLRNLFFAQTTASGLSGFAFDLGKYREALVKQIDNWNVDEARSLYNEIEDRHVAYMIPEGGYDHNRQAALIEYYLGYLE